MSIDSELGAAKRIAHISIIFSKGRMSGVIRKLTEMAAAAKSSGLAIDFYLLNREKHGKEGNLIFVKIDTSLGMFAGAKIRCFKYWYISALVPTMDYDALVLRYSFADPSMPLFMRRHKGKVFFEHHTKELQEIWRSGMSPLLKYVTYSFEKFIAPSGLRGATGIVAVTQEFLEHQQKRARLSDDTALLVLPNGALFTNKVIKLLPVVEVFRFVFVADRFRSWHGLSRLLASLSAYKGGDQLELVLAGQLSESQLAEVVVFNKMSSNIHVDVVGVLQQELLLQLLSSCHMAIDSLATFELGMRESSTLKVRLYLEAGIPWFSATPDADVGADSRVCFLVANNNLPFSLEPILLWRKKLNDQHFDVAVAQLRGRVDWRVKLNKLSAWVSRVL